MEKAKLFDYEVFSNGDIYHQGKKVKYKKSIRVIWVGKFTRYVSYARFVYYAFHQDDFDFNNHSYCVKHKDDNIENNSINNLYITNSKDYLRGEKHKMSKLTKEQIQEIRRLYEQGQDKSQSLNAPIKKMSYRKLAMMYNVNHNTIRRIIKESEV